MDRKIFNKTIAMVLFVVCASTIRIHAQDLGNYTHFRDSILKDYKSFRTETLTEYDKYRSRINEEFARFLLSAWQGAEQQEGDKKPDIDVPVVPPVVYEDNKPIEEHPTIEVKPEEIPAPKPQPKPEVPIEEKKTPKPTIQQFGVKLFGTRFLLPSPELGRIYLNPKDNNSLYDAWNRLADGRMDGLLSACLSIREERKLNDWAYLMLLQNVGKQLSPSQNSLQVLITSYLYANSGYKMRLGRSDSGLIILVASEHLIYDWAYYTMDGTKYYPLGEGKARIEICSAEFTGEQPLSLLIFDEPKLEVRQSPMRELKSAKGVVCQSVVNENLMSFYTSCPTSALHNDPLSRWAMTCNMPLCEVAKAKLYPQLQQKLSGMTTYNKVNLLLNFVQTAFVYEYDDKLWGEDRAFYPDEVLYYPYCDCEDRTALFTRLVRDLVGLECAIVYYPGHLASAVRFPASENISGDRLILNGSEYVICDPTYINASVGRTMPGMDNRTARVMILK